MLKTSQSTTIAMITSVEEVEHLIKARKIKISYPCEHIELLTIIIIPSMLKVNFIIDCEKIISVNRFSNSSLIYSAVIDHPIVIDGLVLGDNLLDKILEIECFDKIRGIKAVTKAIMQILSI